MSGTSSAARDREKMRAEPKQRRLSLDHAGRPQDQLPIRGVLPALAEMRKPARQALDPDQLDHLQVGVFEFDPQLVGVMEVGGGEPVRPAVWIAVLALLEIALHDRPKVRVEQELTGKALEQRAEPGDGGGEDDAAPRLKSRFPVGRSLIIDQATAVVVSVPVELLPSDPDRKAVMLCWVSPGSVWSFPWSFPLP